MKGRTRGSNVQGGVGTASGPLVQVDLRVDQVHVRRVAIE